VKQEATAATNAWVHGRRDVVADARNKKGKGCFNKRAELVGQVEREDGHANKRGKRGKNRF